MKKSLKFLALPLACWLSQNVVMGLPILAQSGMEALEDFDYWQNVCRLQTQAGNPEEALAACEQAIGLKPKDETIWADYSYALLTLDQYPEALAAVDRILSFNEQSSLAMTYQCMAYLGLDWAEAALDACNAALQSNSFWGNQSPALAWRTRGQILYRMEQPGQALIAYDRALLLEPDDSLTLAYRCQTLVESGNYRYGISACEAALTGNQQWRPESPALAWAYQGKARAQLGETATAIAAYDRALALEPEAPEYWLQQGQLLEGAEALAAASFTYARAVELVPDSSRGLMGQCSIFNQQEQYEQAQVACEQAIAGNGDWWPLGAAQAWHGLAHARAGLSNYELALGAIDRAVGMRPDYLQAQSDRSVILWYLGNYGTAVASAQAIVEAHPAPIHEDIFPIIVNTWRNLGRFHRSQANSTLAIEAYQAAISLDSHHAETWSNLSAALWADGKYEEALTAAQQATQLDENAVEGWQNQGAAQAMLWAYPEALISYQRALELDDQNADIWARLGVLQLRLDDLENAIESLEMAIKLNPDQPLARRILEQRGEGE